MSLPLVPLKDILERELPPPSWQVKPLFGRGDRVVLFGEWGSFKSWLLLDLALHLALGQRWMKQFEIPVACRVLYVDEEMNKRTLQRRLKLLANGYGITGEPPLWVLSRIGFRFTASGADTLLKEVVNCGVDPEVIIVESMRRVLTGNENEARDVAEFWRYAEPIPRSGRTLIVSHHKRKWQAKGSNLSRDRASGSTDINAGADASISIDRCGVDRILIEPVKNREDIESPPFIVKIVGTETTVHFEYVGYVQRGDSYHVPQAVTNQDKVAQVQDLITRNPTATLAQLADIAQREHGISRATFYRHSQREEVHDGSTS